MIRLLLAIILSYSCTLQSPPVHLSGKTMGTVYNIKYHTTDHSPEKALVESKIALLLEHLNQKLSTWRSDSEITRFNKSPPRQWFPAGTELHTVTGHALTIAQKTAGVFDPTLGPLINLWGFGPNRKTKIPSPGAISHAKTRTGYQKLLIKPGALKKSAPGMYLDLSASAKGYGVDRLAELLEQLNIDTYMVEIGGEVRAQGGSQRPFWKIGIETPNPHNFGGDIQKVLHLSSHALATSGNYRNFFTHQKDHYSHIIDSSDGSARRHSQGTYLSVTVLDPSSCMNADAWATALSAMGPQKGIRFAQQHRLAARFISRLSDNGPWKIQTTDAFKRILK